MDFSGHQSLRRFNRVVTNRITKLLAGRFFYALIFHSGRKSGRQYSTPVLAEKKDQTIYIPLPYGPDTDWYLNIVSASRCEIKVKGVTYSCVNPELISPADALPAFPAFLQKALLKAGVGCFTRLRVV